MSRRTELHPAERRTVDRVWARAEQPPVDDDGAAVVDGRHARSERSRQAMITALLELLSEGNTRPSSAQIAERAGVTQRTLFNQFGDMDSLVTAVAARQARRYRELEPHTGDGPLEDRVATYCDGLSRLLEEVMHTRWAVLANDRLTDTAVHAVRGAVDWTRRNLREAFAADLASLPPAQTEELLDALELESDPAVWRLRRFQQELTVDEARSVLARTMLALLRDARRDHRA